MKHVWSFPIGTFRSHFHRHLTERSSWESHADSQIGSFRLWRRSAARPSLRLSFPRWNTSTSESGSSQLHWQDDIENSQWLELLHPFTAVKDLYISQEFTPRIAPALQELVGERVTEVLPALQTLFLEEPLPSGPVQETIGQFVAARQLAGHPIAVSRWERK